MNQTITMAQLPGHIRRLEGKLRTATVRGLRSGARRGRGILVDVTPKDRGLTKLAWKTVFHGDTGLIATNENSSPYAGVLEKGARPHPVSKEGREAIYQWVLRNMRLVGNQKTGYAAVHVNDLHPGQRRSGMAKRDEGETLARQITFLICRKIREKGQAPRWFVRDALPSLNTACWEEVERCLSEVKP